MPKGRKLLRGKGSQLPPESQDIFEEPPTPQRPDDTSDEEEEDDDDDQPEADTQDIEPDESTQLFTIQEDDISTQQPTRAASPVIEGPKAKRQKTTTTTKQTPLTPQEERILVEWYKENELFYNKKLSSYRDKARKTKLWEQQALHMGKPADQLEHWIVNMRTRYAKLIDEKSGMATRDMTERDQWIQSFFAFLRPHIVRVKTRTSKVNK